MGIISSLATEKLKNTALYLASDLAIKLIDKINEKETKSDSEGIKLIAKEYASKWKRQLDVFDENGNLQYIIKYSKDRTSVELLNNNKTNIGTVVYSGKYDGKLSC